MGIDVNYEERDNYGMYKVTLSDGPGPALMGADTLVGNDVYNQQDEGLGDVKEIMLDMSTGRVSYAVLSFGGILGMGEKLFAVPWDALTLDTVNKRFTLNVKKDRLENAPDLTVAVGPIWRIRPGPRAFMTTTGQNRIQPSPALRF